MIDAVKGYLAPKRFGVVAYVCLIVHFLTGLALITVTSTLRAGEFGKFSCRVDKGSTTVYKIYVEKTCYSRYEQAYNSPLPLYGFVLLSTGVIVIVSVIYSLGASRRVDDIDKTLSRSDESTAVGEETRQGLYVFYFYFFHLVARSLFGIVFTVTQYTLFYSDGFDFDFSCTLPASGAPQISNDSSIEKFNNTPIACENTSASEKQIWSVIVAVLNIAFALIALGEVVYLFCRRFAIFRCCAQVVWSNDTEFVTVYLLRKTYRRVDHELTNIENNSPSLHSSPDDTISHSSLQDSIDFYKHKAFNARRDPEICYAQNVDLNNLYIDVIITTGRAQHNFSKEMGRHEMFDVYMKVPESFICLNEIKDLFQPNTDTKDCFPHTILVVGRPGIGKSVLTTKIIHDWANTKDDEFYGGKIAFLIKFRWFGFDQFKNLSIKTFLRYGTGLINEEKFESIYEEVLREPQKAIFIFDGLDEFNGDLKNCLEQSLLLPNDPNTGIPAINLFAKICTGSMLKGATVLVTSRPTTESFYSKLNFDRSVEIIGFTPDKIEEYVTKFCENTNRNDLAPKIRSHITNSSDLLHLCYIPVNCFIVCVTLSKCLSDPRNDSRALPTTLTELYSTAVDHFVTDRTRNLEETSSKRILQKLEELSYCGMKNGQLVFNKQHFDEEMRKSGLVNSLSNPIFPIQTQFCFIHLTIQEFLAASHVTKTLKPNAIEKFILTNFKNSKWHLVLQFIAGLLGEKIKMSASSDYRDCCLAFAKSFYPDGRKLMKLYDVSHMLVMRCLREVDDEDIVKQACEQTYLKKVTIIKGVMRLESLSTSDWAAMTFVWKHLKNVQDLLFMRTFKNENFLRDVGEFVQQRCLNSLTLYNIESECNLSEVAKARFFKSLMESKCTLDHEHVKLRQLQLSIGFTDAYTPNICEFIRSGRATHPQDLYLHNNDLTSCGIYQLSKVFNDGHCKELRYLNFSDNENLKDESVEVLCNALVQKHCVLLEHLDLKRCSLTIECVNSLCTFLCDRHCKLTRLSLEKNDIGDKGVSMLCTNALKREQCTLTYLNLNRCSLTDECMPLLCETLKDRNCSLTDLCLENNNFTKEYKNMLCNVTNTEICKARKLKIHIDDQHFMLTG